MNELVCEEDYNSGLAYIVRMSAVTGAVNKTVIIMLARRY